MQTVERGLRGGGDQLSRYFASIARPIQQLNAHLKTSATAVAQHGQAVQVSSQRAASGLGAMTVASLNAYAAMKLLQGAYTKVIETAAKVTAQGQVAGYAGVPTVRARSIARGAAVTSGADEAAVIQDLANIRREVEALQAGTGGQEFQRGLANLGGRAGINPPVNAGRDTEQSFQNILQFLGPAFSRLTQPQQQEYGKQLGLNPRLIEALGKAGSIDELAARGANITATKEQTAELDKLTTAMRKFEGAVNGAYEKLSAMVAGPLSRFIDVITAHITEKQQTPEGIAQLGAEGAAVAGGGLWVAYRAIRGIAARVLGGGANAVTNPAVVEKAAEVTTTIASFFARIAKLSLWGLVSSLGGDTPGGGAPTVPQEHFLGGSLGNLVNRHLPSVGGFLDRTFGYGGTGKQGAAGSDNSIKAGIDFFTGKGLTQEQAAGVVSRLAHESGGGTKLDPNAVNPTSGAYGIAQWLGGRKPAATATGGDLNKQLDLVWKEMQTTENAAFRKIQGTKTAAEAATAMEVFERAGNPSFTQRAASAANRFLGVGSAQAGTLPPGVARNSRGEMYSIPGTTMTPAERAQNDASMAWIRSNKGGIWGAQAANAQRGTGGVNNTTTNADRTVNIDNLNIHTQASDAKGIAAPIHEELRQQLLVDQFNEGLQ